MNIRVNDKNFTLERMFIVLSNVDEINCNVCGMGVLPIWTGMMPTSQLFDSQS
jgi:hypothetical protein